MKWYEDLFVGEAVTGKIKKIKWKIEHNAGMLHTYIITFPSNEENLLDIIPTRELLQKGYPKKNLHIIAVAGNYDEALLLACDIVKETYENTGKTDVMSDFKGHRHHTSCSACSYTYSAALRTVCAGQVQGCRKL